MASSAENNVVPNTKLEKVLAMKGGNEENSYANNSRLQVNTINAVLPFIKETLDKVQLNASSGPFQIVDLGCSTGNNTIYIMNVMVKHMVDRFKSNGLELPDFSAFFSDLPNNDFNTLFLLLQNNKDNDGSVENSKYFAAGVPGSFHRRLFPARTIDVFFSANCLHWLPHVPENVLDRKSVAYNKGKVFAHGANEAAAKAYRKLWQEGLASFLQARSQEIKRGGSMFICCMGRASEDPADQGPAIQNYGILYEDAWNDLVQEGLITSEQRDDFNIPIYVPTVQDFRDVIEKNRSFTINRLEVFEEAKGFRALMDNNLDPTKVGRAYSKVIWSTAGVVTEAHLGKELTEELFLRLERNVQRKAYQLHENSQLSSIVASFYAA